MTDYYPSIHEDFSEEEILDETCVRCEGRGHVQVVLYVDDYGDSNYGSIDCPRCGGGGIEPDPVQRAEQIAAYGAEALEYY